MKRSEVNGIIEEAIAFSKAVHFALPPFAYWTLDDWHRAQRDHQEILDNQMGWDVTDFGCGDFGLVGALIFVLRNGNFTNSAYAKPYCEKILVQAEGQRLPTHFHWQKMEDIINRGGGNPMVRLHNARSDTETDKTTPVIVTMDGRTVEVPAGKPLRIKPGESITLKPRQFHEFWVEPGTGRVLLGEVSTVADEAADNNFPEHSNRLPVINEDVRPTHLIFNDYPLLLRPQAWPETWRR